MWGTDGTVDMRDSKSRAAMRGSSNLPSPTIKRKELVFFLVCFPNLISNCYRNIVRICHNTLKIYFKTSG